MSLLSDPVLPNTFFCNPIYKFVYFIFLLTFCSDHKGRQRKVMLELCVRLTWKISLIFLREHQEIVHNAYALQFRGRTILLVIKLIAWTM
jgi:hypothetical protein